MYCILFAITYSIDEQQCGVKHRQTDRHTNKMNNMNMNFFGNNKRIIYTRNITTLRIFAYKVLNINRLVSLPGSFATAICYCTIYFVVGVAHI